MEHKSGIYELRFPDGRLYIGQSQVDVERRMRAVLSCPGNIPELTRAIEEFGRDAVVSTVIHRCLPQECDEAERRFIEERGSRYPNGHNRASGGKAGWRHSEATIAQMREAKIGEKNPLFGKKHSPETKAKIGASRTGEKHPMWGKKHSAESIEKMSAAKMGNTPHNKNQHIRSPVVMELIVNQRAFGMTLKEIGDFHGVSYKTIGRLLKEYDQGLV